MTQGAPIVIIGAGHAGVQAAASLRDEGWDSGIHLICGEPHLPYHRPPLSKAYIQGKASVASLHLRAEEFYRNSGIELRLGRRAMAIDRQAHSLLLEDGKIAPFSRLVLAMGARRRPLRIPGDDLLGVTVLRTLQDAEQLRDALTACSDLVIIGGGFIGLEVAAAAAREGRRVTVLERQARILERAVSPEMSAALASMHHVAGVRIVVAAHVVGIKGDAGRVTHVDCSETGLIPASHVLIGLGVVAEDTLAASAGLSCPDGVQVDEHLSADGDRIFAIGDCALFPSPSAGRHVRLESVQNANDQARAVARVITGKKEAYTAVPWFWSDQYASKLQIAGLRPPGAACKVWGSPREGRFSVLCFDEGRLVAVESLNRPRDHIIARKLLNCGGRVDEMTAISEMNQS